MKREGTIGAAAFLAIAAAVGISLQTGPKPAETSSAVQSSAAKRSKKAPTTGEAFELKPGCGSLKEQLEDFLEIQNLVLPENCYEKNDPARNQPSQDLTDRTSRLKFVIALLPDPVHTHLPVLFDQFAVAIQEGAQDEKYDFDGSWLPWDDQDPPYALFLDEKAAGRERELKENSAWDCPLSKDPGLRQQRFGIADRPREAKSLARMIGRKAACRNLIVKVWWFS